MRWRSLTLSLLALGLILPGSARSQDQRSGVGVFRFVNGGSYGEDAEVFDALEVGLQQLFMNELASNGSLRVVDRAQLSSLMSEQDLGTSGRVDPETAARIGRLVGARYMFTGGFIDWYGDFRLMVRIVNVETGEIIRAEQKSDDREKLFDLVVELAQEVMDGTQIPSLPAAVQEERAARQVPTEAMTLYSRALFYQERGQTDRARQLLNRVQDEFPVMAEDAQQALRQLGT